MRLSPLEELPRPGPVLSASFASRRVNCHAGTNAASSPVVSATVAVNASTRVSTTTSPTRGRARTKDDLQEIDAVVGRGEAGQAAAGAEHETFGEKLLNHAQAAGAEGAAQRDLLGAAVRPHQHQVGEIRARDQQHQRDGAEEHQQRRAHVANHVFLQRPHQRAPVLVVVRILRLEPRRDRRHVGLSARHIDARLEFRDAEIVVVIANGLGLPRSTRAAHTPGRDR